jgi:hypothetical protein
MPRPRHTFITAFQVAKGKHSKSELTFMAARWVLGLLTILNPTVILASKIFNVSPSAIHRAIKQLGGHIVMRPLISAWTEALYFDRKQFAEDHADEFWALVDREKFVKDHFDELQVLADQVTTPEVASQ